MKILQHTLLLLVAFCLIAHSKMGAQTTVIVGGGSAYNPYYGMPCPLTDITKTHRAQYLYRASDLSAAGIPPGSSIVSIGWVVVDMATNTHRQENYTIRLANTTVGSLSSTSWETGLTTVYGPTTYSCPQYAYGNIMFSAGYTYNGNNLLVEICGGVSTGTASQNPICQAKTYLPYNGSHTYASDNPPGGAGCGVADVTEAGVPTTRPALVITYTSITPCSGAISGGTAVGWPAAVCPGASSTLNVTGGTIRPGLSYQWQSSPDSLTWTDMAGATTSSYELPAGQSAGIYYRRKSTCATGSQSAYSSNYRVNYVLSLSCYCTSGPQYPGPNDITNVTFNGINNTTGCGPVDGPAGTQGNAGGTPNQYSDFTGNSIVTNLTQGNTYTLSVAITDCGYAAYNQAVMAYIDWNRDGDWADAGETYTLWALGYIGGHTNSLNVTVPSNASPGNTYMRIVVGDVVLTSGCGGFYVGEVEDYKVNILAGVPCTGTPGAAAITGPTNKCYGAAFTLTATGLPAANATGLSYQWQSSPAGAGIWSAVGSATQQPAPLATSQTISKDYRLMITCVSTGLSSVSNTQTVTKNISGSCYCTPGTSATACTYMHISKVSTTGGATNINNTSACAASSYTDYTASLSASQTQGLSLNLGFTSVGYAMWWNVYVDYNDDADFTDPGELVYTNNGLSGNMSITGSFTIPLTAPVGSHVMRVRGDWNAPWGNYTTNPCTALDGGETEDYVLTVLPAPPCTGTPVAGTVTVPGLTSYCASAPAKLLKLSGYTAGVTGLAFQWQASTNGLAFNDIPGAISDTFTTPVATSTSYYRARVTCISSGASATSTVDFIIVNPNPVVTISPATALACSGSGAALIASGANTYSWSNGTTGGSITTAPLTANATFTVTGTTLAGCSSTASAPVFVGTAPNVSATATPGAICAGSSTQLQATVSGISYCTPAMLNSGATGDYINNFSFGSITNNNSGDQANDYKYYSNLNANLTAGTSYNLSVQSASTYGMGIRAWIDYNQNGIFETFESVWNSSSYTNNVQTGSIIIPTTALNGITRMRIVGLSISVPAATQSCYLSGYGEYEDYNITISGGITNTSSYAWSPAASLSNAAIANPVATTAVPVTYQVAMTNVYGCVRNATASVSILPGGMWTGAVSSDWNNAGNWCGGVPTATSDVVISGGVSHMPELSSAGYVNNIVLQSGSTLSISDSGVLNLYGNITGTGYVNAYAGSLLLAGTAPQIITAGLDLGTLRVSGGGVKTLSGPVSVGRSLHLDAGILDIGSNNLALVSGAAVIGGSPTAYVRMAPGGRMVQDVASTPARFPIGNTTYNPATLTNAGTTGVFAVGVREEVLDQGAYGSPLDSATNLVVNRTWDVQEFMGGGSGVTMTLQWNSGEPNRTVFDYNNVYISQYTGNSWDTDPDYPTAAMAPTAGGYPGGGPFTATRNNITSFSSFSVSSIQGTSPLPVTLVSLSAENEGSRNQIKWQSATETNMKAYVLERSVDGMHFNSISEASAQNKAWNYMAYDDQPNTGFTYYRLKMENQGGSYNYSKTVKAFMGVNGEAWMTVQPNPVQDLVTVKIYGAEGGEVTLTDVSGRVVATAAIAGQLAQMNVSTLATGTYFVHYKNGLVSKTVTITKQ